MRGFIHPHRGSEDFFVRKRNNPKEKPQKFHLGNRNKMCYLDHPSYSKVYQLKGTTDIIV